MSALVQEIQVIRALRKTVRNQPLTDAVMKAMEMIHRSIATPAEDASSSSSKRSEWRGRGTTGSSAPSSGSYSRGGSSSTSAQGSSSRGNYFGNRNNGNNNGVQHHQENNGGGARRFRHGGVPSREVISVPLETCPPREVATASTAATSEKSDEDGFETVRRPGRRVGGGRGDMPHHASQSDAPVHFRSHPPQKYVSRFRKETDQVEDIILNKILLGKLNKFSASNYAEIKEFITHIIDNGETEMIKCFMKLVFEKAASEEMFCPLYARLLSELSTKYPILLDEMKNLYAQYLSIFEEVPANASSDGNYQELCQRNVAKKYRRGYTQFLAELIKYNVIDLDVFIQTVSTIIHQAESNLTTKESVKVIEEYADCLMKIIKVIKVAPRREDSSEEKSESESNLFLSPLRTVLKKDFAERIQPLTVRCDAHVGLSNKARFTFLDIYEEIGRFSN